jgi:hypothetical protein
MACGLRNLKQVYLGGALVSEEGRSLHPRADEADRELRSRLVRAASDRGLPPPVATGW